MENLDGEFQDKIPYFPKHSRFCMSSYSAKWAYVPIHKNASSIGIEFFSKKCGWKSYIGKHREVFTKDKNFLIFVREPISRWISGVSEYFNIMRNANHKDNTPLPLDDMIYDLLVDGVSFDVHTEPQATFLYNLPYRKCKLILMDENFTSNVKDFAEQELGVEFDSSFFHTDNITAYEQSIRSELKNRLLNNPQHLNKLKLHLNGDYFLLSQFDIELKPWNEYCK